MHRVIVLMIVVLAVGALIGGSTVCALSRNVSKLTVTSTAFRDGETIPTKYTADGANVSPPLSISGVPSGSKSIALICDDPDAPRGTFVHWVLFNWPVREKSIPENVPPVQKLANGAMQGKNDFGRIGYGGPAPPSGVHRYYFKVYALDIKLDLKPGSTKQQLEKAMKDHIVGKGQLMGRYGRK